MVFFVTLGRGEDGPWRSVNGVDYRANRWDNLYRLITREPGKLTSSLPYGIHVMRASGFAQALARTPTFRRHFGSEHSLWTIAGLAWWFNGCHPRTWLFQCDPEKSDLPEALDAGVVDRWGVHNHKEEIHPGDRVVIWCGGDLQACYAFCKVTSEVKPLPDTPEEEPYWQGEGSEESEEEDRVLLDVERALVDRPITKTMIQDEPILAKLPIGKRGTNFALELVEYLTLRDIAPPDTNVTHWIIAPGEEAKLWDDCLERDLIRVGWSELDFDLRPYDSEEKLLAKYEEVFGNHSDFKGINDLVNVMSVGDRLFVKKGRRKVIGYGEVVSEPFYDDSLPEYRHYRKVEWLNAGEWPLPPGATVFPIKTLTPLRDDDRIAELRDLVTKPPPPPRPTPPPLPSLNVIYYGPPGTGKTYELLSKLAPDYFTDDEGEERFEFVTFHQSYSYEDFVEGIRPVVHTAEEAGDLKYEIKKGIFRSLAERARTDPGHYYALFIDEISRANVAGVFGELITLIEEDKREGAEHEVTVKLPYSRKLFSVPSNLYIIGTMNTADRSVEALDSALRRRFAFIEMAPRLEVLPETPVAGIDLQKLLAALNGRIRSLVDKDHCIGHSYLMHAETLNDIRRVFCNRIVPLLEEYFYGDPGRIGAVLGMPFVHDVSEDLQCAPGDWGMEEFEERRVFELVNPMTLSAEDFQAIYA